MLRQFALEFHRLPGLRIVSTCCHSSTAIPPPSLGVQKYGNSRFQESIHAAREQSPAFGDRCCQVPLKVAEEQKWRSRSEFFPHENQRSLRRKQQNRNRRFNPGRRSALNDSVSESPVPYLIMVL